MSSFNLRHVRCWNFESAIIAQSQHTGSVNRWIVIECRALYSSVQWLHAIYTTENAHCSILQGLRRTASGTSQSSGPASPFDYIAFYPQQQWQPMHLPASLAVCSCTVLPVVMCKNSHPCIALQGCLLMHSVASRTRGQARTPIPSAAQ